MKDIFFSSTYFGESGPNEVNRNLVENFPKEVSFLKCRNRYFIRLETIFKIICCKVVIISALGQKDYEVKLAKLLGKKIIYIMHGFAEDDSQYHKDRQDFLFPCADLILCVSSPFREQVISKYPKLINKLGVLNNGIAWEKIDESIKYINVKRDPDEIVLIGGGRFIKKNLNVCKAVQQINKVNNTKLHVSVYGSFNETDESRKISEFDCVTFVGLVSHKELLQRLCASSLLVQASLSESFGLSVVEALACGCNIVVSQFVGAIGVISAISKEEIISDPENIEEIAQKIEYVISHPNNTRLLYSIDRVKTSLHTAVQNLINIANKLR